MIGSVRCLALGAQNVRILSIGVGPLPQKLYSMSAQNSMINNKLPVKLGQSQYRRLQLELKIPSDIKSMSPELLNALRCIPELDDTMPELLSFYHAKAEKLLEHNEGLFEN